MIDDMAMIRVELTRERAEALALFLKRQVLDDFVAKCSNAEIASLYQNATQSAAFDMALALAEHGFDAR